MANTEEVNSEPCSSCEKTEYLFDNLFHSSQILEQTCEKLRNENDKLKREKQELEKLLETFQKPQIQETSKKDESEENKVLKKNVHRLENDITKFVRSTETFQNIIGAQKNAFDKTCIGFKTKDKQKLYENLFIPKKRVERYKCTYCKKYGHLEKFCFRKERDRVFQNKKIMFKTNFIKFHTEGLSHKNSNHQGPKKIWVPKNLLTSTAGMPNNSQEKALVLGQWMLKTYDWR